MERLYPNPKTFVDNSEPDLDAEYFNGVEAGLSAVDERLANLLVSSLTTTVAGQKALDAIVGRILDERITANAEAIAKTNSNLNNFKNVHNMNIYSDVSQIGLTYGCSVEDIILSLPNNSIMVVYTNTANHLVTDVPISSGSLTIKRSIINRVVLEFDCVVGGACSKYVRYYNAGYIEDWVKL